MVHVVYAIIENVHNLSWKLFSVLAKLSRS